MSFIHLHTHSHYSLLDGLPKIDELVEKAKEYGMEALALTDHGVMYGAIEFYKKAKKAGIKPIIGVEFYIAPHDLHLRRPKIDDQLNHLVVLAKNQQGYKNLLRLTTIAHLDGFYYKPRIDKKILREHAGGLICLSGCLQGDIPKALLASDEEKAIKLIKEYQEIFGNENFYLEIEDHRELPDQLKANELIISLAKRLGVPVVATKDSHYIYPEDKEAQDVLICVQTGKTISDKKRLNMTGFDSSFPSEESMEEVFKGVPETIENTQEVAKKCNLDLELGRWDFPCFEVPNGKSSDEYLKELAYNGLKKRFPFITVKAQKRLDYELKIIEQKGFSPYFLIVADFVSWTKKQGIISTTRGSAAGSLVAYALGITTIDPLKYKLPFERFLNLERPLPPDIDLDFADLRREEVIDYVIRKYGQDKVARICTFGSMMARGAVRDVTRVLGLPYSFGDKIAKMIPFSSQGFYITIEGAKKINPELQALYESDPQVKKVLDLAKKVEGCVRHVSVHAAGVVIAPTKLTDYTPLQREPSGENIITQYEMHSCEDVGLLKIDLLGIRNLTILGETVKIVEKTKGKKIDLENLPLDDKKTYHILSIGETIGLFQLGGSGMTRYLKQLRPTSIFDIMAMVALFRPGPMNSIPEFIARKHNPSLITSLDPRMKDILNMSYGVIVYQDDVLLIAIKLAGYTWEEADKLRRAMGKKIPKEMWAQREKFITGCVKNGLKEEKAVELWNLIEPFAAYGFNKSHAASYAKVAYQTAYMKAHFPTEFMTAVMTAESGNTEKIVEAVKECEKIKIKVLAPDINQSLANFTYISDQEIRFGLLAIKNLGSDVISDIIKERKENGLFSSLEDFLKRIDLKNLNKKSLEALIKSGSLDSFAERNQMLQNLSKLLNFVKLNQREKETGQVSLFSNIQGKEASFKLDPAPPADKRLKLNWEKELLGLYVSEHPFKEFEPLLKETVTPCKELCNLKNHQVQIAGIITKIQKVFTRSQETMLFVTLEDVTSQVEILVFPSILKENPTVWQEDKCVLALGKISDRDGVPKLLVNEACEITLETVSKAVKKIGSNSFSANKIQKSSNYNNKSLTFNLKPGISSEKVRDKSNLVYINLSKLVSQETNHELRNILSLNPGKTKVCLLIPEGGEKRKIETKFTIEYNKEIKRKIEKITGPGSVKVDA